MTASLHAFTLLLVHHALTAEPATLQGSVKDEQGQPLDGVLVAAQGGYDQKGTVNVTRTDATGAFELKDVAADATTSQVQYFALKHGWGAAYKRLLPRDRRAEWLD